MKITKRMAEAIAEKLVRPKYDIIKEAERKFKDELSIEVEKTIPLEIMSCYKKYPAYFRPMTVRFCENVHKTQIFSLNNIPVSGYNSIKAEDVLEESSKLFEKLNQIQKEFDNCLTKNDEIITAIMSFSTVAKLENGFPEAFKAIPESYMNRSANLPSKNIDLLRNWIVI